MTPAPWLVGIDVSKAQLDIALRPEGRFVVPNDETGHTHVVERLRALPVALIVLEATGGLELPTHRGTRRVGVAGRGCQCISITTDGLAKWPNHQYP